MKTMKSLLVAVACVAMASGALGATLGSEPFRLSLKADGVRASGGAEVLRYSSAWAGTGAGTVTIRQDGETVAENLSGTGETGWSVERNGRYVLTHTIYEGEEAVGEETATFVVTGLDEEFAEGDVTVEGWSGKYDGTGHGVTVTVAEGIEGAEVRYATGAEGEWSGEAPLFTDVCAGMEVWVEVSAPGYVTATNRAEVTVLAREVALTSASASKPYDGTALTAEEVSVGGDGWAAGEGADYEWSGAQTDVGASENGFTYTLKEGTKAGNYAISVAYGTLEVTKANAGGEGGEEPGGGSVPEGGASKFDTTWIYDGEGHTIDTEGLEAAFGSTIIGAFTVEYAAGGEDGGEEAPEEGWAADAPVFTNACEETVWYRVRNPNYEDFVHPAKVTIAARPVTVEVTGRTGTFGYDGAEKGVEGYEAATEEALYDIAAAVGFGGTAEARRTDAGTTAMGLSAEDFTNTDANFAVTFAVEDGWVTVEAADISEGDGFEVVMGANPKYDGTEREGTVVSATWQGLPMTFEVAGNTGVHAGSYTLTLAGTGNFAGARTAEWGIERRTVTLESASATRAYTGEALTAEEVSVGGDGWAEGEGAEYVWTGAQTVVGTSKNTFAYSLREGTLASDYDISVAEGDLTVTMGTQSIDFSEIGTQKAADELALEATASSGLTVTFAVLSGPATLDGEVLRFVGPGVVSVAAMQGGDGNWFAAETVVRSFEVVRSTAVVRLSGLEQGYDGTPRVVGVATEPAGLRVSVTYDGGDDAPVEIGSYAVVATVVDAIWEGSATGTLVVAKGSQSIEFAEIGAQVVTNVVELGAVASSGLAVSYAVEGPAVLDGKVLSFTGVGTVTVTASQAGDENWEAAEDVAREFAVGKASAVVTLGGLDQAYDGKAHGVTVTTDPAGLTVVVTYDGEEEEPVVVGRYAVAATVEDAQWEGSASGTLVIAKGSQSIEFAEIGSCGVAERLELRAEADSGLPVTFAVLSGPAILEAGGWLRFAETGVVSVAAMQFGDANWEAAETVRQEFAVVKSGAVVTLGGLEQVFDGKTHGVDVTTEPAGLSVVVTYDGGDEVPVDAGEYAVVAEVVDAKWAGSAEGVLVIAKGAQSIEFPEIGAQVLTNRVMLGATASSGLPVEYAVAEGPGRVEDGVLSFTGVGTVVVVARQAGDANWEAAEEVRREVQVSGSLVLRVESAHGTAVPAVGEHEVLLGAVVEASVDGAPVALGEGWRAVCTGWWLEGDGIEASGEGTEARFAVEGDAVLTWLWETQALVRAEGLAHGTAEGGGWYAVGTTATLTAVPEEGHPFTGWEGDFGTLAANPASVAVRGPGLAVATFFTTYYASEDGNDGADGLSRSTAKREIAAALAEAAFGDEVVAAVGTYGAIVVPEGVSVRSDEGAEKTTIRGGLGTRSVEAAADTVVEGFALEGGETDGDGGGALLADGAELTRCILRGNKAGGVGGGAKGGVLENCLVVGNEASAGGGAAGAVLRHCTVVRNVGGGAKDCRTVSSVFWENEGGDVAGGSTEWSLCNPAVAGQGNIEGEACFVGEEDWRLAYESPCIDAAAESGVRTDLTGAPRPQPKVYGEALKPDMGCYEYVPKARFVWAQGSATPPYESWKDAAHDIQSALDISGGGDRVVVEAGTYGAVTVSNAVILMGYRGAEETVIDGGNAERAVTMTAGGVLEGFTVRNGASEDCGGILADGGALVRDVVVEGCRATGAEGGGGGLCLYGGSVAENVAARENKAAYGGGIYATEGSAVEGCEMAGNAASAWGGGAWLGDESRMAGSVAAENTAVRGAGVYGEECEIADCAMSGNVATGAGGGAAVSGGTFRNNVLQGNRAASGGGLFAQNTDGHDCLVVSNAAPRGAGVWAEGNGELWNLTVADNEGTGAGVALRGETVLGNSIVWGNAGGNLDAESGTDVRYSCAAPVAAGEGNFAEEPSFVGAGDYHLRAGSPCVDAGEVQEWMPEAYDFDGQRRVEVGAEGDGRDIWVDVGTDEAAQNAVGAPTPGESAWTWRVVQDARLQLQSTSDLLNGGSWTDAGEAFTATNQTWTLKEPFEGKGAKFYRLIWLKE